MPEQDSLEDRLKRYADEIIIPNGDGREFMIGLRDDLIKAASLIQGCKVMIEQLKAARAGNREGQECGKERL